MVYVFLTSEFNNDYAHCTEIEQKVTRPYTQVLDTLMFSGQTRRINADWIFQKLL